MDEPEPQPHPPRPDDVDPVLRGLARASGGIGTWEAVFDSSPAPSLLIDLANAQVRVNAAYRRMLGIGDRPILSIADLQSSVHPDEREELGDLFRGLLHGEVDEAAIDRRYVRDDGDVVWGHLRVRSLRDSDGVPVVVLSVIEDISDRILATEALAAREAWFGALVRNGSEAIIVLDDHARLVYASPGAERLTGQAAEERVGGDALDFVHPDDRAIVLESFLDTASVAGVAVPLRFRVAHADGSYRLVEAVATNLLEDDAVRGVVVNLRDLSDTQEVRTALELSETRFRRMLENISDTVTLIDDSGNVIATTGNVKAILGYTTEFWDDRNVFDLIHPEDVDRVRLFFVELLGVPGGEATGELRVEHADGGWADVEISAVNLLDDPQVGAIVLTTRNITARKQGEQQLAEARDQAVRALAQRTEFIANVSHELRTPIHGILGLSELLATSNLDEEARSLARSIGRATQALRMVLDDILDYSKIEIGRLEVHLGPVSVPEMANDLTALFAPQARAKGIAFDVDIADDIPEWVLSDGLRIRQVLTNLIGNAVKFTSDGGVTVELRRMPARGAPHLDVARVAVRDTGIGVDAEAAGRLFEPFSQAHRTTAREFGGTGLGLSIARRLVELLGGRLDFDSTPGEGSTFWFELPLVLPDHDQLRAAGIDLERDGGRIPDVPPARVLVVEDNETNQLLVRRQLERLGCTAVVLDSGTAALDAFARGGVDADLVLMDWQLPGIDGLETTRRWRVMEQERGLSRTPVVAMTASALPGDRDRCLDAGMDDFLAKPVSMATLGDVVRRWTAPADLDRGGPPSGGLDPAARPDPSPTSTMEAIDATVLHQLVEELDDPLLAVTVVRTYLRELDGRLDAVVDAIARGDRPALVAAAHILKSTSAAVGAGALAEACGSLEAAAATSSATPLPVTAAAVRELGAAVRTSLDGEVARLEGGAGAVGMR